MILSFNLADVKDKVRARREELIKYETGKDLPQVNPQLHKPLSIFNGRSSGFSIIKKQVTVMR